MIKICYLLQLLNFKKENDKDMSKYFRIVLRVI